jgi:ABC-type multidrug transport system ATPase subunit/5'-deoxynucleotidase YfbR-like HD superfamily hydrolase
VALVGESGSGKSTLTRMLLGLLPTQEGSITIDGVDLGALDKTSFRRRAATILQDPVPFNASLAFNIAYLEPGAAEPAIWAAAQEAGLHDDIVRLAYNRNLEPSKDADAEAENALLKKIEAKLEGRALDRKKSLFDNLAGTTGADYEGVLAAAKASGLHDDIVRLGYASRVGERGVNLSGGQKQRLLLARLFINSRSPWDLMILDEPTAALDGITQKRVQEAIERRRGLSTVVIVAHRLSTIQRADTIVVLNRGRIVEQGSHDELLRKQGAYAKLWQAQRLIEEATAPAPEAAAAAAAQPKSLKDALIESFLMDGPAWDAHKASGALPAEWIAVNESMRSKVRSGWPKRGIPVELGETVWQHSRKLYEAALAYADGRPGIDARKAALMALFHDVTEYRAPDFTPGEITAEAKYKIELDAADHLVKALGPQASWIRELWLEFERGESPEAKLVRQLDKLDNSVQALRYERQGYSSVRDFYADSRDKLTDPELVRVFEALMAGGLDPYEQYLILLRQR